MNTPLSMLHRMLLLLTLTVCAGAPVFGHSTFEPSTTAGHPAFGASHFDEDQVVHFTKCNRRDQYVKQIAYFEDVSGQLSLDEVLKQPFQKSNMDVQNMGVSPSVFWFRVLIHNDSELEEMVVVVDNSLLDSVTLFSVQSDSTSGAYLSQEISKYDFPNDRSYRSITPEFHVNQPAGVFSAYYIRVESFSQLLVPIKVLSPDKRRSDVVNKHLMYGLYFGVMLVMFLYNLFLFSSVKDRAYFYYICYVLSVVLVQLNVTGIGFKYIWSGSPEFERQAVFIFPSLTALFSILFIYHFLNIKLYLPRASIFFSLIMVAYGATVLISFTNPHIGYNLINANALPLAIAMIGIAAYIYKKYQYRPAGFFLVAWTAFLVSIIVFVLKDYGLLPYNSLTVNALLFGSSVEVVLLSFALADKINVLEAENRASREEAYLATQETGRIISEQNMILEQKVQERTQELQQANDDLAGALYELQETQTQLVESEKMASLGQLTAGIAHEINNPINFVTSNVTPLKRDISILQELIVSIERLMAEELPTDQKLAKIEALKNEADYDYLNSEIDHLLNGISEGATRTSDIVRGLRLFSRLDEDDVKLADLREGLDSTIAIVNHLLNGNISIERDYEDIPLAECFPGKLNQVFLNLMTNGIHAIQERWGHAKGGVLQIRTFADAEQVHVSIRDNGIGMSEETKRKLFEPFFTTKDVGVGTGLGLSIGWNTIKKHNGHIQVDSTVGVGTEFLLSIPIRYEAPEND